jgi:nitrite reductase/ring-hydroxylating ferredoxin subunit
MRVVVAPVRSFPSGERRIVEVGGRSIGVFRVGERFYGVRNRCPHQGGPLCLGHVLGDAVADAPGASASVTDPLRIACPWHGWEYDLETGECTADRRFRLRRIEVREREGEAYVVV